MVPPQIANHARQTRHTLTGEIHPSASRAASASWTVKCCKNALHGQNRKCDTNKTEVGPTSLNVHTTLPVKRIIRRKSSSKVKKERGGVNYVKAMVIGISVALICIITVAVLVLIISKFRRSSRAPPIIAESFGIEDANIAFIPEGRWRKIWNFQQNRLWVMFHIPCQQIYCMVLCGVRTLENSSFSKQPDIVFKYWIYNINFSELQGLILLRKHIFSHEDQIWYLHMWRYQWRRTSCQVYQL